MVRNVRKFRPSDPPYRPTADTVNIESWNNQALSTHLGNAYLGYQQAKDFLQTSVLGYAYTHNPPLNYEYLVEYWCSAEVEDDKLAGTIGDRRIVIDVEHFSRCLHIQRYDVYTAPPAEHMFVDFVTNSMGFNWNDIPTRNWSDIKSANLSAIWKYLFVATSRTLTNKTGGHHQLSRNYMSIFIALCLQWKCDFSQLLFNELLSPLREKHRTDQVSFPRFLMMCLSAHPDLAGLEHLNEDTLALVHPNYRRVFDGTLIEDMDPDQEFPLLPGMLSPSPFIYSPDVIAVPNPVVCMIPAPDVEVPSLSRGPR